MARPVLITPARLKNFWEKVDKSPHPKGCWIWTAFINPDGYGMFNAGNKHIAHASVVLWVIAHGQIEGDLSVLHKCDNPACVNPKHLFLGTQTVNIMDMVSKNRHIKGELSPQSKLTDAEVIEIRKRYAKGGCTHRSLAKEYGVDSSTITNAINHKYWKHVSEVENV